MDQIRSSFSWQEEFGALIGIDWADEEHYFYLGEVGSEKQEKGTLKQTPEALEEWVTTLREKFGGARIAIALEQSKGALTNGLMKHDFIVLYPVDGKKLKAYRESYISSGASDDPTDAQLLWEYLYTRGGKMNALQPDTPEARLLAQFVERRRATVDDCKCLSNQLQASLKRHFPQAVALVGENLTSSMALDFLRRWPTLQALKKSRKRAIEKFYTKHGCRSAAKITERLELIDQAIPLTDDLVILEDGMMLVERLIKEIALLHETIEKYETRIDQLMEKHPDAEIYASIPGAGKVMEPRLAAAMGTDRGRWESEQEILTLHGIAPVTERSGKRKCFVHWRWACHKFTRQTWHEFADHSRKHCAWAKAFYHMKKEKGLGHHAALRTLAYKWIRIIFRCWKNRTPYDESQYLQALRKHGSPVIKYMEENNITV